MFCKVTANCCTDSEFVKLLCPQHVMFIQEIVCDINTVCNYTVCAGVYSTLNYYYHYTHRLTCRDMNRAGKLSSRLKGENRPHTTIVTIESILKSFGV